MILTSTEQVTTYQLAIWRYAKYKYNLSSKQENIPFEVTNKTLFSARSFGYTGCHNSYSIQYSTKTNITKDTVEHEIAHIVCWELPHVSDDCGHDQNFIKVYYALKEYGISILLTEPKETKCLTNQRP